MPNTFSTHFVKTYAWSYLQNAQSKKGKAAEKSPQTETAPSAPGGASIVDLYDKITAQGNKVRDLKAKKVAKVRYVLLCNITVMFDRKTKQTDILCLYLVNEIRAL